MLSALAPSFADARDITDEAFARALGDWPRVRMMESPGGWVSRVAVNELKRRHRRVYRSEILGELRDAPAGAESSTLEAIELLRSLPPRERTVMALRFLGDLSEKDVADRLGIKVGTVSAAVHSARQRLQAEAARDAEGLNDIVARTKGRR